MQILGNISLLINNIIRYLKYQKNIKTNILKIQN
jgi:hypothetical protein